jgi:hypothetical protein
VGLAEAVKRVGCVPIVDVNAERVMMEAALEEIS